MERLTERRSGVILDGNKLREYASELYWRLKAYEDAEEQGMLIRLPCKVGNKVYSIEVDRIEEFFASNFDVCSNGIYAYQGSVFIGKMGYTVFATKEEAEQSLAKMKEV